MDNKNKLLTDLQHINHHNPNFSPEAKLVLVQINKRLNNNKIEVSTKIISKESTRYFYGSCLWDG